MSFQRRSSQPITWQLLAKLNQSYNQVHSTTKNKTTIDETNTNAHKRPFHNNTQTHVIQTMARCFSGLSQLRSIRESVPADTFLWLVVSLVMSRLDYENSTLAGLPVYLLNQLQAVMNAGARLVFNVDRCEHVLTSASLASCPRSDYF